MTTKGSHPVIQVVDGNKQDIGTFGHRRWFKGQKEHIMGFKLNRLTLRATEPEEKKTFEFLMKFEKGHMVLIQGMIDSL